ncbi:MAG: class I SAM-dependent methyltransferase [Gammaproteobacteria bacterium]|nr:class I SAM-dependent methyltransferase [Gammaproteobacteria bacterium]
MSTQSADFHPLRGRFNAWLLAKFEDEFHEEVGGRKASALGQFRGTVLEIGAGNGVNFRYYPPGIRLMVYEPNPHMHPRLLESARSHQLNYELRAASAEDLEFEDNSVDAAVCTLVLCTVPDPERVVAEVLRVLKPGGRFFFIEHVAAARGTGLRKLQDLLLRPWRWLFEGCHTNRETAVLLEKAGFSRVDIERFKSEKMPPLIVPQIAGVATK